MDHKTILHEGLRRQREALLAKLDGLPEHELRRPFEVELVERLRPMLAFDGLDALLVQMRADIEDTARILDVPVPEPIRPEDVTAQ